MVCIYWNFYQAGSLSCINKSFFHNILNVSYQYGGLCAVLPYLQEVQLLLEGQEVPTVRVENNVQCCKGGREKTLASNEVFQTDLSTWVALLSRRPWLTLRSLKEQYSNSRIVNRIYFSKNAPCKYTVTCCSIKSEISARHRWKKWSLGSSQWCITTISTFQSSTGQTYTPSAFGYSIS